MNICFSINLFIIIFVMKKNRYETDIFFYYLNKNLKFTLIFDKENFLNISVIYLKNVNILTKINQKK